MGFVVGIKGPQHFGSTQGAMAPTLESLLAACRVLGPVLLVRLLPAPRSALALSLLSNSM